uniref:LysM peptidoglycan-binding domain-containing protein n=1 Tax=Pseudoalteromonas sp. 41-MNA-CIBAN-0057 TaxID=3140419 RepID=UPI003330A701
NKSLRTKLSHTVKSGDTLWDISREYDVTMGELAKWNKLKKNAVLRLNQKLVVYKSANQPQESANNTNRTITYQVRRGDS